MADRRLFNKKVLMSTEFLFELSGEAKNLYLAIGLNTDTYGFVVNYGRLMEETRADVNDMQELINKKFVYLIDKDTLVDLKFQINNMIAPSQQNEPIYPQGLKYVYMDIDCQYHWSSTKIRKVVGYAKGSKDNNKRTDLFIDAERTKDKEIKEVDTTQQKASDFLGTTPAKKVEEPQQVPSVENTTIVQPDIKEVAPQLTKQGNKVQDELKRLESEQDNDFETKMKEAYMKGQEAREDTPQSQEQPVNPYITTEDGQQQREALDQEYKQDQQQDINPDELDTLVAGAQTRSMPDTQTVESTNSNDTDQKLTADGLPDFLDNEADKAEEEEKQARYKEQGLNEFGYTDMRDTSDLPF